MEHRARNHLNAWKQAYPASFSFIDVCHQDRTGLPDWPEWCYVPIAAAVSAAIEHGAGAEHASTLAGLAAWRMTQGIYRFDSSLYESLIDTPVSGGLPTDVLYQLPEWCVYIETPSGVTLEGEHIHGAYVWLEHDVNDGRNELRMLLDGDVLHPCIVHLGGTVEEGIERARLEAQKRAPFQIDVSAWVEPAQRIMSLALYMCSVSDYSRGGQDMVPGNPTAKRTKRGTRLFAASGPAMWDVGVRMGSALRKAYHDRQIGAEGQGGSVRGHIRRGHWHAYRVGPKKTDAGEVIPTESRKLTVRWMPPIAVNLGDISDLPATIRRVRE